MGSPKLIHEGEADETSIAKVRREVRNARWTLAEYVAKTLIPALSLSIALVALLSR